MVNNLKEEKQYNTKDALKQLFSRPFTIPNFLCFARILIIVPFVKYFLEKNFVWAAIMIVISALTDCCDGFIARTFHQESELGKILDPLADKLTLLAVGICLCFIQPFLIPVILILIVKDVLMLIGSSKVIKMGVLIPKSKWYGKLGTIMFYLTVTFIVFLEVLQSLENPPFVIDDTTGKIISVVLLSLTALMMIYAFIRYAYIYKELVSKADSGKFDDESTDK